MARFRPLSEHGNIRFGEGSYDVRNWKVRTTVDDQKIGEVHDVLVDESSRTRYLDLNLEGGRHVLVPSGEVRVDANDEVVEIPGMDRNGMNTLPEYQHSPESITPEYSRSLTTAYDSAYYDEHHYQRADYTAGWERGSRTTTAGAGKLERLDKLDDIDVASGEADPRGWEVVGADGERVGKVDHILGDTAAMKARYLTVELDDDIARDRQVLVPVGHVALDTTRNRVRSNALDRTRVTTLPAYEGGPIDREYETGLTRGFDEAYQGDRYYEHPRYRSSRLDTEEARVERR